MQCLPLATVTAVQARWRHRASEEAGVPSTTPFE
jgi:hypothetical protein